HIQSRNPRQHASEKSLAARLLNGSMGGINADTGMSIKDDADFQSQTDVEQHAFDHLVVRQVAVFSGRVEVVERLVIWIDLLEPDLSKRIAGMQNSVRLADAV